MKTEKLFLTFNGTINDAGNACTFEDGIIVTNMTGSISVYFTEDRFLKAFNLQPFGVTLIRVREDLDRYRMNRVVDVTGNSGNGHVADVIVFPDGKTIVHWRANNALGIR